MASWLSSKDIPCHVLLLLISLDHLPVVNSSACPGTAHQSLFSICQSPCILVDLHPHPGYVGPWHGFVCVILTPLRLLQITFPLQQPQMLPFCPNQLLWCGDLNPGSAPQSPRCRLVLFTIFLCFPSFLHSTKFCVDLCILFRWSGTPASSQLIALQDLHLKMYSWCIHGERYTLLPPTPLPSCLPWAPFLNVSV